MYAFALRLKHNSSRTTRSSVAAFFGGINPLHPRRLTTPRDHYFLLQQMPAAPISQRHFAFHLLHRSVSTRSTCIDEQHYGLFALIEYLYVRKPVRAVTLQSMVRTSSPRRYSRTSANSIPRPLNAEWYSPANRSLTTLRDRISISRTFSSISSGITTTLLGNLNVVK